MIDITMTATIRPSILDRTLQSFCKNLFTKEVIEKHKCRLILNVDPIGENSHRKKMLAVAQNYFSNILLNCPDVAGFTKAVIWCWSKVEADYVFHLEDDWNLLVPINIENMIEILNNHKELVSLRLNKERTGKSKFGNKKGFIYNPKLSLNPTLIKGDFVKSVVPLMDLNINPEKQLRSGSTPRGQYIKDFTHGIYVKEEKGRVVQDIGRSWMDNSNFTKKIGFMKWEIKKEIK